MERIILILICSIYANWIVKCELKRKRGKPEEDLGQKFIITRAHRESGDASYAAQKRYEQLQHDDYLNNRERYEKWPNMDQQQRKQLCQRYVQKVFRQSRKLETNDEITPQHIPLTYRIIEDRDNNPVAPIKVSVLQCHIPNSYRRKYLHFIRGPRPHCLFLLKPLHCNWTLIGGRKDMAIVNEFCIDPANDDQYNESFEKATLVQRSATKEALKLRLERKNDQANSLLRTLYEQAHFNYYNLKPSDCQTWPELKNTDKGLFCRIFLQKILGTFVINELVLSEVKEFERLLYVKILKENAADSLQPIVSVLRCNVPKASKRIRSVFQFIRGTASNCVFLVKPTARNLPQEFVIFNGYCDTVHFYEKFVCNLKPTL